MTRMGRSLLLAACLVALAAQGFPQAAKTAPQPDLAKVIGTWSLQITADGMVFYLEMVLEKAEGWLAGKVSEQSGMFIDAPLSDISFDGETLTCTATVPSPPDMAARPWVIKVKVEEDLLEGAISNDELEISAFLSGKRTKR